MTMLLKPNEPLFVIGMEIIIDSQLEAALDACSLFDASAADGLSFGHPGEDDTSAVTLDSEEEEEASDDDDESDDEEGSLTSHTCDDEDVPICEEDELMARLAGSYLNQKDDSEDGESDDSDSSDSEIEYEDQDFEEGVSLDAASRLGLSANTNIAVMMDMSGKLSLMSSLGGDNSGTGRSRRHRGSRRRSSQASEVKPCHPFTPAVTTA